jgi:hypothetical protein
MIREIDLRERIGLNGVPHQFRTSLFQPALGLVVICNKIATASC